MRTTFLVQTVAALVLASGSVLSHAQTSSVPGPYAMHWAVGSRVAPVDLRGGPIQSGDVVILWQSVGKFPIAGPHMIEMWPGGREQFYATHLQEINDVMRFYIPDPNYTGYAVIDYETWTSNWWWQHNVPSNAGYDAQDQDFLDDWRDYIRQNRGSLLAGRTLEEQEDVFRTTWIEATREFYVRTIRECKRLRPNAKWGFYSLPKRQYFPYASNQADMVRQRREIPGQNDASFSWLADESDVIYPSVYIPYRTVETPRWGYPEDSLAANDAYLRGSLEEAQRMARGKPVVPFLWYLYHNGTPQLEGVFLNEYNLRASITTPQSMGLNDIIMWGHLENDQDRAAAQSYYDSQLSPIWTTFHSQLEAQRNPPPAPPTNPGNDTGGTSQPPAPPPPPTDPGNNSGGSQPPAPPAPPPPPAPIAGPPTPSSPPSSPGTSSPPPASPPPAPPAPPAPPPEQTPPAGSTPPPDSPPPEPAQPVTNNPDPESGGGSGGAPSGNVVAPPAPPAPTGGGSGSNAVQAPSPSTGLPSRSTGSAAPVSRNPFLRAVVVSNRPPSSRSQGGSAPAPQPAPASGGSNPGPSPAAPRQPSAPAPSSNNSGAPTSSGSAPATTPIYLNNPRQVSRGAATPPLSRNSLLRAIQMALTRGQTTPATPDTYTNNGQ